MQHNGRLLIFDLRPNIYKVGIYREITQRLPCEIIFLNDLGITEEYYDRRYLVKRISDAWLLKGLTHKFIKTSGFLRIIHLYKLLIEYKSRHFSHVLIQGYNNLDYWVILIVAKFLHLKILYRGEGTIRKSESKAKFLIKSTLLRFIAFMSNAVFYTCHGNLAYYRHYLWPRQLIKLKPLSCSVDNNFYQKHRLTNNNEVSNAIQDIGIDQKNFVVLFVGQLGLRKRPFDVIDAVYQSVYRDKVTCLFVGSGPLEDKTKSYAKQLGVNSLFAGFVDQLSISKYYSIADVFMLPSEYDNSPKVLNEAMNFGLPCIVTDVCGQATDLIDSSSLGYVVEVGDVDTMAHALDSIVQQLEAGTLDRSEILNHVSKYNFERNAQEVLDAL